MTDYLVPLLLLGTTLFALRRQENSYTLLLDGAAEGLKMLLSIIPALVILLTIFDFKIKISRVCRKHNSLYS